MKAIRYSIGFVALMASCQLVQVEAPDAFSVSTEKTTFRVGEPVRFSFTGGNIDQVVFFSGEIGRRYEQRTRTSGTGENRLVFQSSMQQGVLPGQDSLRLLVSTNLAGYDAASVTAARWTDITSRNTRWPTTLATTFTTSDSLNLNDFATAEKVNIAFRFIGKRNAAAAQRRWQIQNAVLINRLPDGTVTNLFNTFANTGWVQVSQKNNAVAWNVGTAGISAANSLSNTSGILIRTAYPISLDPGTATGVEDNDDWLITSAVNLKTVRPDVGLTVKNTGANMPPAYLYTFTRPGTYTVTFIGMNRDVETAKEVVRQLQLTITP
ncbi:DUF5017 domain-containing protein [Rudanella lutea]|uniref:DUF5017 domain-containing protein n=1 Tax=Rudanella lutea TaxID=451374 RepID=UPI000372CB1E|nr:DUF5017 domain-containing protein [Rudanella lutea]